MKKVEKKIEEVEIIGEIICDSCGKSCNTETGWEYMSLKSNWGYSTNKDLEVWEAQICEKCVDECLNFINFQKKIFGRNIEELEKS